MLGLIDSDYIAYLGAFASQDKFVVVKRGEKVLWKCKNKTDAIESIENEQDLTIELQVTPKPLQLGYDKIDTVISSILFNAKLDSFRLFLSGQNNFRKELASILKYKGTRVDKPIHLDNMREYLLFKGAEITDHLEADDIVTHYQVSLEEDTVIISNDKDLLTVPGLNYNPSAKKLTTITEELARYNFYFQLLTGDNVDNIPSPKGIGKITATKILAVCLEESYSEYSYYNLVRSTYIKFLSTGKTNWYNGEDVDDILFEIGNLLYMKRSLSNKLEWSIWN